MNGISALNLVNFFSAASIDSTKAKEVGISEEKFAEYDTDGDGELTVYEMMDNEEAIEAFFDEFEEMLNEENKKGENKEV